MSVDLAAKLAICELTISSITEIKVENLKRLSVKLDTGRMAYVAGGKGPALLLLHNAMTSADAWSPVFKSLAQSYSVYAPDMLGHGHSDKPAKNYLVEDYAASMFDLMDKLGIVKSILCGNSIGALIAVEMAATYSQRVEKLILVGCLARDLWARMERLAVLGYPYDAEGNIECDADGNPLPFSMAGLARSYAHPTPEHLKWFNSQRAMAGKWWRKALIALTIYEVRTKLPLVKCPTLVLFGDHDPFREWEKVLLDGIKGAKHALVKDAGHPTQIENPQDFLGEVNKFLSSH